MNDPKRDVLDEFAISHVCGFLPETPPLQALSDSYYGSWEQTITVIHDILQQGQFRKVIDALPLLNCAHLRDAQEWRRAYVILGIFANGYIWGEQQPSAYLPPQIAKPLLEVADLLNLPSTATYATLNLWNFNCTTADIRNARPEDFRILHTFTGTRDEEWFFAISNALEAGGGAVMNYMIKCNNAAYIEDTAAVTSYLQSMAKDLEDLGRLLKRMYEHCRPEVFYHQIRPFLAGSKNVAVEGCPKGVFYDEGDGHGSWREYSGGSNAQSSTIQFLDIILGVQHFATGDLKKSLTSSDLLPPDLPASRNGFLKEMRRYMPSNHREFLEFISQHTCIRQFVLQSNDETELRTAYDSAVLALAAFRDVHLQIVARYIIQPSRRLISDTADAAGGLNLPVRKSSPQKDFESNNNEKEKLAGTGGTDLMAFLKQTRDETRMATVEKSQRSR